VNRPDTARGQAPPLRRQAWLKALSTQQRLAFGWTSTRLRFSSDGPALLLSPHLDDAVLGCWSLLTSDRDVQVVNVFAGVPPSGFVSEWDRKCGAASSAEQVCQRRAEDAQVLTPLVGPPANLPFLDMQYARRDGNRVTMSALDRAVAQIAPAVSLVYAPAALGEGHVDHRLVRAYARVVPRAGIPIRLYADLPYAARPAWPDWVRIGRPPGRGDRSLPAGLRHADGIDVVNLGDDEVHGKLEALQRYGTQFTALDEEGYLTDPQTLRHEVFWNFLPDRSHA
jgi:LmbE family N-acetylglucosaminyl deacetylase